jgi:hypothetical protein
MTTMTQGGGTNRGNPFRWPLWLGAAALLSLPAIAMQFQVEGVDWTASDFVVMGVILAIACGSYELVTRLSGGWMYRAAGAVGILAGFMLVWVNLAVGLVAEGGNVYNLAFMGVLGVGVAGALLSRFRASGLSRTLFLMAIVHALVVAAALFSGLDRLGASLSALWLGPWLLSAILFRMVGEPRKV